MMLGLGGVHRLVASIMTANPSVTQISSDELYHSVDLISVLIRSTIIPPPSAPLGASPQPPSPTSRSSTISPFLLPELSSLPPNASGISASGSPDRPSTFVIPTLPIQDLQSFLNGIFLEDALNISTTQTALAIQHLCWSRGANETKKILMFLTDKINDCTVIVTGVDLSYRPYFRTCSEVLLSDFIDVAVYESVLHSLLSTADALVSRQCPNDAGMHICISICIRNTNMYLSMYIRLIHYVYISILLLPI